MTEGSVIAATTPIMPSVIKTSARVNAFLCALVKEDKYLSPPPLREIRVIACVSHILLLSMLQRVYEAVLLYLLHPVHL